MSCGFALALEIVISQLISHAFYGSHLLPKVGNAIREGFYVALSLDDKVAEQKQAQV